MNYTISLNHIGVQTIKKMQGTGTGSSVETLDADNEEKYLYVLYKKVEVQDEMPAAKRSRNYNISTSLLVIKESELA